MNTKVLVAALIGGVLYFLLGWLIYGMLLSSMMESSSNMACIKAEEDMSMPLLIVAHLVWGYTLALILSKWGGGVKGFSEGAGVGAILGLLISLGIDLWLYAFTQIYTGTTGIIIDVIGNIVMGGIVGGAIGWWFGRGNTA